MAGGHPPSNNATDKTTRPAARWLQVDWLSIDGTRILASVALLRGMSRMRTLPSGFIEPCLPTKADTLPSGGLWLHEIKHDGFRIVARKNGAQVKLYSRPGNDLTDRFPLIVETLANLRSRSCIIDAEAVACDDNGLAVFDRIRYRHHDRKVFLYAFDLIELDGDDLRHEPLDVRKATLRSLLVKVGPGLRWNEHIEGDGETIFRHACKLGLEGIVSKRKDSPYRSGRSPDWLKMKNPDAPAVQREAEEDWGRERWR
jgi:bifunctional non-homologous end joining protein LigD